MTRSIAFYAPLKSPNHPTPSGDRTMARGLMNALSELGEVALVSEFRSRDGVGDATVQATMMDQAEAEAARLIAQGGWDAWVTYHNYYKAPDLIGPKVCAALGIPYHLIEASRASKRLDGPWARFARQAEAASDAAKVIYYFTQHDHFALGRDRPDGQRLVHLKPFLDRADVPAFLPRQNNKTLLAVGMFRRGDKVASFTGIAAALSHVTVLDWTLRIIGDGEAKDEVRALFEPFGAQVEYLGQLPTDKVAAHMAQAKALVWPGVNEAFGMVYLEAQAMGLPIVAEDRPGVRDVVGPAGMLVEQNNAAAFAKALDRVLLQPLDAAPHQDYVAANHLRGSAVATLRDTLIFATRLQ